MASKVSVIIPVFNAEQYLEECLNSVLGQTLRDIEVICVDDGSQDRSPAILSDFAAKDGRIRAITKPNGGAGSARNRGIDEAKGEYLAFIDADDFWDPPLLENAYMAARKYDTDLCYYPCEQYDVSTGKTTGLPYRAWFPKKEVFSSVDAADHIFQMTAPGPCFRIYRRNFIDGYGLRFLEQHIAEDMYFTYLAAAFAEKICRIDQVYAYFRRGMNDNLSSSLWKYPEETHHSLIKIKEKLQDAGLWDTFRKSFRLAAIANSEYAFYSIPEDALPMERRREMLRELDIADKECILPCRAGETQKSGLWARIGLVTHMAETLGLDYTRRYLSQTLFR